jgi:hypothetical protein
VGLSPSLASDIHASTTQASRFIALPFLPIAIMVIKEDTANQSFHENSLPLEGSRFGQIEPSSPSCLIGRSWSRR